MFCREQAARINELLEDAESAGVSIVGIGNGTALMAQDFAEAFAIGFPLYTDPKRVTYQHFGMKRTFGLWPSTLIRSFQTFRKGFRQGKTQGDPWQQGGLVLLDTHGNIRWRYVEQGPGQHADLDVIRKAMQPL